MNNLGKFLVTVIMTFSVMFAAFAISVRMNHKDWKSILERNEPGPNGEPKGLIAQLNDEKSRLKQLEEKLDSLKKAADVESQQRVQRLAAATKAKSEMQAKRDAKAKELEELEKRRRETTAQVQVALDSLKTTLVQIAQLEDDIKTVLAGRDQAKHGVESATDQFNQLKVELARVKDSTLELARQLGVAVNALLEKGLSPETSLAGVPPTVDGVVLDSREGLVEFSLGSDDGLEVGHTMIVFRRGEGQNRLVGKLEVVELWDDKAVGKLLPEFQRAPVEKDDRVATRL